MDRFEVVVIGGGWGGYTAAVRAAERGLRTALVERDKLGGTCLHRGCIPTKALLQTAEVLALARRADQFGVRLSPPELDYERVRAHKDEVVERLYKGLQTLVRGSGVTLLDGTARIAAAGRVAIENGTELEAANIVVATGSVPRPLPGVPFDGRVVLSSDDLLAAERPPRSIVILGAGAVGVEFASCYADYGCDVTLVEMAPRVLPLEDRDVSAGLARLMSARGIAIHTGATALPESVTAAEGGVHLTVRAGDHDQDLSAEALLVAIGRAPLTEGLGLDVAGVKLDRGFIAVDERMRTSAPGIYAVGDVNGGLLLAHVAAAEGALAADTIAGVPSLPLPYGRLPRATYCRPQVASIGLTEVEARERGHAVATARAHLRVNGKALIAGEPDGFVKVVVDTATSDVLGVHILGAGATELIAELALGQTLEAAVSELAATVHPHPTLSEAIGEAAHRALQRGGA